MKRVLVLLLLTSAPAVAQPLTCEDRRTILALNAAIVQQQQVIAAKEQQLQQMGRPVAPMPMVAPRQPPPAAEGECP